MEQLRMAQDEFKCPVCLIFISPPIRQCEIGHIMCTKCFEKITQCPVCRGSISDRKALMCERLYEKLQITCTYKSRGCDFKIFGGSASEHERKCIYAPQTCPLRDFATCGWVGDCVDLFEHCDVVHRQFVGKGGRQTIVVKDFAQKVDRKEFSTIIQAHGEVFRLSCAVYIDHRRWYFSLIGIEEDLIRYFCIIKIGNNEIKLKPILRIPDDDDVFSTGKPFFIETNTIGNISNDGTFEMFIQIFDRGLELYLSTCS